MITRNLKVRRHHNEEEVVTPPSRVHVILFAKKRFAQKLSHQFYPSNGLDMDHSSVHPCVCG
jgi:hypothetical protein